MKRKKSKVKKNTRRRNPGGGVSETFQALMDSLIGMPYRRWTDGPKQAHDAEEPPATLKRLNKFDTL